MNPTSRNVLMPNAGCSHLTVRIRRRLHQSRGINVLALLLGVWLIGITPASATESRTLDHGWQVRLAANATELAKKHPQASRWLPAAVPGSVQLDLLHAGLIPDPYRRDNEANLQWIGLADWDYRLALRDRCRHAGARSCGPGVRRTGYVRRCPSQRQEAACGGQHVPALAHSGEEARCMSATIRSPFHCTRRSPRCSRGC